MGIILQIVLIVFLALAGLVGVIVLMTWLCVYGNPLNFPAIAREGVQHRLSYRQRVAITGGFFIGHTGTLLSRSDEKYEVEIDGYGGENIAIRHLRPLLPAALPSPKEQDEECEAEYPELPPRL